MAPPAYLFEISVENLWVEQRYTEKILISRGYIYPNDAFFQIIVFGRWLLDKPRRHCLTSFKMFVHNFIAHSATA